MGLEGNAVPVHDDNSIESRQPGSDKVAEEGESLEGTTSYQCQEADDMLEDSVAELSVGESDQMIGGDGASCI